MTLKFGSVLVTAIAIQMVKTWEIISVPGWTLDYMYTHTHI